jgi:hypothetical protein
MWDKKNAEKKWKETPNWKKADDLLTSAASIRVRYQGRLKT